MLGILKSRSKTFLSDHPFYSFYSLNVFFIFEEEYNQFVLQNYNGEFRLAYLYNTHTYVGSVMIIGPV
jgi:hypothetical protein